MSGFVDRLARVYADYRFNEDSAEHRNSEVRALAIALLWDLERGVPREDRWRSAARAMCLTGNLRGHYLKGIIRADSPRYQPPGWLTEKAQCETIRPRGTRCPKRPTLSGRVTDWATGQWRSAGWCTQHSADAEAAWAAERARAKRGFPEPQPNIGGLLALHVPEIAWDRIYAKASINWVIPALGMDRNAWPGPQAIAGIEPPQLQVIFGTEVHRSMEALDVHFDRPLLAVLDGGA